MIKIPLKEGIYTKEEKDKILEKARNTEYKHECWFKEGGKTVEQAIGYYANTGDFYLDIVGGDIERVEGVLEDIRKWGLTIHQLRVKDIVNYCINTKQWKPLTIRYAGKEKGTDRGKLKIETYLILKGLV